MFKYQKAMYDAYNRAPYDTIYTAYNRPSVYKVRAYEAIKSGMLTVGGWGLKVVSHNCNFFSCAYEYADPETGVVRLAYFTGRNTYDFEV